MDMNDGASRYYTAGEPIILITPYIRPVYYRMQRSYHYYHYYYYWFFCIIVHKAQFS